MNNHSGRLRVVATGVGAVSPLGSSVALLWDGLLKGSSGIRRIEQFDASSLPCQIAGEIPDFEPKDYIPHKEIRRIPRSGQIALAAAVQAVSDAGFDDKLPDNERCGVVFGTGIGGFDFLEDGINTLRTKGFARVNPFALPNAIPNLPAFLIARQFQCLGPSCTITTACATGTQAIGEAVEHIRRGVADVVISGGTESLITDYSIAGFSQMRVLPLNYNNNPKEASRPFDAKREGFVFSEGAAVIVLEEYQHALKRGARMYAEVVGYASSSDAYHISSPSPEVDGPVRAMGWAIQDAGIHTNEVHYINAHGTSTPLNDEAETKAIKTLFGDHAYNLAVSSTKSMIGHAMGASGALETLSCILSIYHGWIPPTINYEYPDPECDLDYVPNHSREQPVRYALKNSFGLGGQNACLILKKIE